MSDDEGFSSCSSDDDDFAALTRLSAELQLGRTLDLAPAVPEEPEESTNAEDDWDADRFEARVKAVEAQLRESRAMLDGFRIEKPKGTARHLLIVREKVLDDEDKRLMTQLENDNNVLFVDAPATTTISSIDPETGNSLVGSSGSFSHDIPVINLGELAAQAESAASSRPETAFSASMASSRPSTARPATSRVATQADWAELSAKERERQRQREIEREKAAAAREAERQRVQREIEEKARQEAERARLALEAEFEAERQRLIVEAQERQRERARQLEAERIAAEERQRKLQEELEAQRREEAQQEEIRAAIRAEKAAQLKAALQAEKDKQRQEIEAKQEQIRAEAQAAMERKLAEDREALRLEQELRQKRLDESRRAEEAARSEKDKKAAAAQEKREMELAKQREEARVRQEAETKRLKEIEERKERAAAEEAKRLQEIAERSRQAEEAKRQQEEQQARAKLEQEQRALASKRLVLAMRESEAGLAAHYPQLFFELFPKSLEEVALALAHRSSVASFRGKIVASAQLSVKPVPLSTSLSTSTLLTSSRHPQSSISSKTANMSILPSSSSNFDFLAFSLARYLPVSEAKLEPGTVVRHLQILQMQNRNFSAAVNPAQPNNIAQEPLPLVPAPAPDAPPPPPPQQQMQQQQQQQQQQVASTSMQLLAAPVSGRVISTIGYALAPFVEEAVLRKDLESTLRALQRHEVLKRSKQPLTTRPAAAFHSDPDTYDHDGAAATAAAAGADAAAANPDLLGAEDGQGAAGAGAAAAAASDPVVLDEMMLSMALGAVSFADAQSIEVTLENVSQITDLWRLARLRHLSLNSNLLVRIAGLEKNTELETVKLRDNRIERIEGLGTLSKLTELVLDQNHISMVENLSHNQNLKTLSLSNNRISVITGLDELAGLQKLLMYRNRITKMDGLGGLVNLTYLDLGRNRIRVVEGLENLGSLETLILYENSIEEFPVLTGCPRLKRLWLNGNRIERMARITGLPQLEYLNLQDNQIASLDPESFICCPNLQTLNLAFNSLTDMEAVVRELMPLSKLRALMLNDNPCSTVVAPSALNPDVVPYDPNMIALVRLHWLTELNNAAVDRAVVQRETDIWARKNNAAANMVLWMQRARGMSTAHGWMQHGAVMRQAAAGQPVHFAPQAMGVRRAGPTAGFVPEIPSHAREGESASSQDTQWRIGAMKLASTSKNLLQAAAEPGIVYSAVLSLSSTSTSTSSSNAAVAWSETKPTRAESAIFGTVPRAFFDRIEINSVYLEKQRSEKRARAALKLQRVVRGYLHGRLPAKKLRAQRRAELEQRSENAQQSKWERELRLMNERYGRQATTIQRVFRGFRVRLRLSRVQMYQDDDSDLEELDIGFLDGEGELYSGPAITTMGMMMASMARASSGNGASTSAPSGSYLPSLSIGGAGGASTSSGRIPTLAPSAPSTARANPMLDYTPPVIRNGEVMGSPHVAPIVGRLRPSSAQQLVQMQTQPAAAPADAMNDSTDDHMSVASSADTRKAQVRDSIAGEWGFSSESTLDILMKRRQQLKKLRHNKDKLKEDKDPEKRLEKFRKATINNGGRPPVAAHRTVRAAGSYMPKYANQNNQPMSQVEPEADWELQSVTTSSEVSAALPHIPGAGGNAAKKQQTSPVSLPPIGLVGSRTARR